MQNRKCFIYLYVGLTAFIWMFYSFSGVPGTKTICFAQEPANPSMPLSSGEKNLPALPDQPPAMFGSKIETPKGFSPGPATPITSKSIPENRQMPLMPGQPSTTPGSKIETPNKKNQGFAPGRPEQGKSLPSMTPSVQTDLPSGFSPGQSAVPATPQRGMVTLNFDDADVFTIIQTVFGTILKVNYVVDSRVKGRVTFRAIAPVPLDKVLPLMEVILRLNGIGVVEENGLYRLVPIADISREPSPVNVGRDPGKIIVKGKALLQVAPILYMSSAEAIKLLSPFTSSNAVLIDVPKSNQIIIVDTDTNVKRLLQLIEVFDNEKMKITGPQVFVYSVHNGKAKDIATILQQTFQGAKSSPASSAANAAAGQGSTPGATGIGGHSAGTAAPASSVGQSLVAEFTKFIADEVTNSIIVLSTPEEYLLIKAAIDKIDIIPRQVIIEGLIAQVTLTDNLSLGVATWIQGSIGKYSAGGGVSGASLSGVDVTQPSGTGLTLYALDVGTLRVLIQSLATDSRAKLLATPHILVSDNREAKIQVGQQVPLVTSETYGSTTVAPQRTIQYRDIGIILKVKPRINEGGLVALELYQEVSTFETVKLFADETQIILNKNDATTSVVVQDGQTIVIGGLIREDTSKSKSGIPFLTKIPLIGWIFGSWTDNKQRTEIIILLTPRVVKDQAQANNVTNEYIDGMADQSKGRITKKELLKERKTPQSTEQ